MRHALLISAVLLAGCNNAGNWKNEQAQLANDLNAATTANEANVSEPAGNEVNATQPAANEVNAVDNKAAENQAAPQG